MFFINLNYWELKFVFKFVKDNMIVMIKLWLLNYRNDLIIIDYKFCKIWCLESL